MERTLGSGKSEFESKFYALLIGELEQVTQFNNAISVKTTSQALDKTLSTITFCTNQYARHKVGNDKIQTSENFMAHLHESQ